jgi:purine-binding chemotaxis protein CheW
MPAREINWSEIHTRLAATAVTLSGDATDDGESVRRVLAARARVAARPQGTTCEARRIEVLAFALAGERYAVETRHVVEVRALTDLTPLPCTPPWLAGVLNLRGQVLAVIDLRRFFELPDCGLTELNRVVVLRGCATQFGLLADSIEGNQMVDVAGLQDGLATLTGVRAQFLKGITGQMLAVLDGDRLLAAADLKINAQVAR